MISSDDKGCLTKIINKRLPENGIKKILSNGAPAGQSTPKKKGTFLILYIFITVLH